MIVEIALLSIRPGSEASFEAAFPEALAVLAASKGYLAHELRRSVETPNRYALRIESPPVVEHFRPIAGEA